MDLNKIINQDKPTIIDVREPYEFEAAHAKGAINIPLGTIPERVKEIKKMSTPIVVYCRSGMRSENAMSFLKAQGMKEVYNGGSLNDVFYFQNKAA
ncbi:MAG: phage shock protein E [Saprospiraceae bacterium]|jgi:phage shock protein E